MTEEHKNNSGTFLTNREQIEYLTKRADQIWEALTGGVDGSPGLIDKVNTLWLARNKQSTWREKIAFTLIGTAMVVVGWWIKSVTGL